MEGQAAVAWVEEAGSVEGRVVVARRARAEARAVAQGRWKQPLAATRLNGGYTRDNGIYCARAQCASSRNAVDVGQRPEPLPWRPPERRSIRWVRPTGIS